MKIIVNSIVAVLLSITTIKRWWYLKRVRMRLLTTLICLMSSAAFQIVSPEVHPEFGNAIYYVLLQVCFSSSNPPVSS